MVAPAVFPYTGFDKAQLFVDVLGALIFQHGVQGDAGNAAVSKQIPTEHGNQAGAKALFLPVALTDFDADFSVVAFFSAPVHLSDGQTLGFDDEQVGAVVRFQKLLGDFFYAGAQSLWKSGVLHHLAVVPPAAQQWRIGGQSVADGQFILVQVHLSPPSCFYKADRKRPVFLKRNHRS